MMRLYVAIKACSSQNMDQHIFDAVKASLERLQLDYIDVLQCKTFHAFLESFVTIYNRSSL